MKLRNTFCSFPRFLSLSWSTNH